MSTTLQLSISLKPLQRLMKASPKFFNIAMERGAIQFLNWANNGSSKESRKPPIRWGVLRGSSSAFVGSRLVAVYPQPITSGGEPVTPERTNVAKNTVMTFVWNTEYATKMHEWKGGWGPFTIQDGDAGNKWLEKHLRADKDLLMQMITLEFKKVAGL